MINTIIFNGRSLAEFGALVDTGRIFPSPEKDYNIISIPGRNGDLSIYNNRFKDVEISVRCYIKNNFVQNYRSLIQFLNGTHGYQRFEDTNEPNYFRKALFLGAVEPVLGPFNKSGSFNLVFRCHPQRWLKASEELIDITDSGSLTWRVNNLTNMPSKPYFRFKGNGTITIYDADNTVVGQITITNNSYEVEIDCETMDCWYEDRGIIYNKNSDVTFSVDPVLVPGENMLVYSSDSAYDTVIEIAPRFFMI